MIKVSVMYPNKPEISHRPTFVRSSRKHRRLTKRWSARVGKGEPNPKCRAGAAQPNCYAVIGGDYFANGLGWRHIASPPVEVNSVASKEGGEGIVIQSDHSRPDRWYRRAEPEAYGQCKFTGCSVDSCSWEQLQFYREGDGWRLGSRQSAFTFDSD